MGQTIHNKPSVAISSVINDGGLACRRTAPNAALEPTGMRLGKGDSIVVCAADRRQIIGAMLQPDRSVPMDSPSQTMGEVNA